jgi:hypothetical protein
MNNERKIGLHPVPFSDVSIAGASTMNLIVSFYGPEWLKKIVYSGLDREKNSFTENPFLYIENFIRLINKIKSSSINVENRLGKVISKMNEVSHFSGNFIWHEISEIVPATLVTEFYTHLLFPNRNTKDLDGNQRDEESLLEINNGKIKMSELYLRFRSEKVDNEEKKQKLTELVSCMIFFNFLLKDFKETAEKTVEQTELAWEFSKRLAKVITEGDLNSLESKEIAILREIKNKLL